MVWTVGTTLAALLFVCGGEIVSEVKANEEHALAFHQGSTSRGHTLADEDHSPVAAQRPGGEQSSQLLSDRVPALSKKGSSGEQNEGRTEDDVVTPAYLEDQTLRPPLLEGAQFDTAEEFLQSNAAVQYAFGGLSATRVGTNEERQERQQTRTPSISPTGENDIEDLGREFVDHKQQEWLQIGGYAAAKKRSRPAEDATAMGGQKEDLRQLPMEQQIFQMQQEMAMREAETQQKISTLRAEMQQKIAMLETNATACTNNVTDLVNATTDIRHAGAVVEEASGLLLAQRFAVWWVDYVRAVVYLLSGFAASLIVVALPVRLVFFPREYSQEEVVEPEGGGDHVTPEPQQGATVVAGGDQADTLSADRPNPPPAKPEKYWLLPWDFARRGTLSSVCQRGDSTEGKIFTTGLVIAEICALLSHYTLILYDRTCSGFTTVADNDLDSINTERSIDLALRVVWLILPPVIMIITAAVPQNTFRAKAPNAAPTTTAGTKAAGSGNSATRNRVTTIHEDDTRIWSQALHQTVAAAVLLRLIFETRQLFHEPLDISGVLFGVSSDPLDEPTDLFFVNVSDQRVSVRCKSEFHRSAWAQAYRGYYLGRVIGIFLGWAFSLLFLALSIACKLQYRHAEDRSAEDRPHASAYLEDVRLVPQSASLILPRLVFSAEILAMLTVQALPFWPVLLKVARHGQGASWNPPLTPLDVLLRVSFRHLSWRANQSQCGHYFDTDKNCGDFTTDMLWLSQEPPGGF
ncbi:unnamed protein product [Amoebophrya sp. A120]|nr:unnamed protein product [Amoebophrya sp. A120]|eukprot:GSA120T00000467001.1